MAQRTCTAEGCERPHRARGLCGSHYNQAHVTNRHKRVEVECSGCGTRMEKFPAGKRRPVCSQRCRYFVTYGHWPPTKEIVGPVALMPIERTTIAPTVVIESTKRGFVYVECNWCGNPYVWDYRVGGQVALGCSKKCRRAYNRASHGDRFRPAPRIRFWVYERDDWTCQLCHEPVDRDAHYLDDWAPSLDHIECQSWTGEPDHSPENLRTAHRWCNSVRNDGRGDFLFAVA